VEVDEQPKWQACEAEIREDLGLVHGQQMLDRFDLDQHLSVDDHVEPELPIDRRTLEDNRESPLPLDVMATLAKLALQTFLVRGFQ
jgi:hypothetical protein